MNDDNEDKFDIKNTVAKLDQVRAALDSMANIQYEYYMVLRTKGFTPDEAIQLVMQFGLQYFYKPQSK